MKMDTLNFSNIFDQEISSVADCVNADEQKLKEKKN
jgi:hypothetical protein